MGVVLPSGTIQKKSIEFTPSRKDAKEGHKTEGSGTWQSPTPLGSRFLLGAILFLGRSFLASSRLGVRCI